MIDGMRDEQHGIELRDKKTFCSLPTSLSCHSPPFTGGVVNGLLGIRSWLFGGAAHDCRSSGA